MQKPGSFRSDAQHLKADLALIDGPFLGFLREQHFAELTIKRHRRALVRVVLSLNRSGRRLSPLCLNDVPAVMGSMHLRGPHPIQPALRAWLKFRGRYHVPAPRTRWQSWVEDYVRFLETDRGISPGTRSRHRLFVDRYMAWQFRRGAVDWRRVVPQDLWRYASKLLSQGHETKSVRNALTALRQFLRFVHLRGGCRLALSQAMPTVADHKRSPCRDVLTEEQRKMLFASFDRRSAEGLRDYTMALCMSELGLRCIEVARLCLGHLDLEQKAMTVPAAKRSSGRQLPLPVHVAAALRSYVRARPATNTDRLFVGHRLRKGRPLSTDAVRASITRGYRRCSFAWSGTHRLRRGFATRLYARGATLKEIADLLGHQWVTVTQRYAQVDRDCLRALVRPWPA